MTEVKTSKIYSIYFPEEVVFPPPHKTANQSLKDLLMELVAHSPIKAVSEELRPTLIALKSIFYKEAEQDLQQLEECDSIASKLLEKKQRIKTQLTEKIGRI